MKFAVEDPRRVALLVIDMENDFVKPGAPMQVPMAYDMVPRLKKLLEACREKGATVIYTSHVHSKDRGDMGLMADFWEPIGNQTALVDGTEGIEIFEELAPKEGELLIKKHRYSAFYNTDLETQLRNRGIDTLIITGTVTNMCCESTARDAQFRDYRVIFVSDATGTMDHPDLGAGAMTAEDVQQSTLTSLSFCIAEIASADEVMDKLKNADVTVS
ncbi:ureidoacrylate peracid hydrolase [Alteribacillus persepolensis]|uniref:Ureidoacrylate peracid hydrolase n=1 Tax=Alteribacillus persepolensis TaxID=568899 RepID=A0A1G8JRW4_9BACI|nr:isochorismatase family cysteine hydrolase [Alteribacillus persepolensis]SDI33968.1 ureidoacrylate peracid hydrolase [Alteribacillus persepolensis]